MNNEQRMAYRNEANGLMEFFKFGHLPPHLQEVSRPFAQLANQISEGQPSPELVMCLRKLLESKDCAVRNALK